MKQPVERRLAAILAADVAGYARLMGADEEGTLDRLKAHRRGLVDRKIKEHNGRIVKTTGDGMLVEFLSVVDAVRCAVEMQRAMLDRNAETLEDKRITFRIGVNLGDVIIDGGDIYGDGVNIAARLEALAEPGGICISRVVRDQIRDKLPYSFADMGEQNVKNIARPVRAFTMSADAITSTPLVVAAPTQTSLRSASLRQVFVAAGAFAAIAVAIVAWWTWPHGTTSAVAVPKLTQQGAPATAAAPAPRLSIVVLPFANLSNDPDQEYFADGITDDLTTDLSRISGSFVIARNTAFTYKGKPVDAKQIGRELGVRYVLEGSVRRTGDQVRVNVQLIDSETGAHVWADRFDNDRTDLVAAQDGIVGRLARSLNLELVRDAGPRIEREQAANPDARDVVMRAWALWYGPGYPANVKETLRGFERALEIDPRSIDAKLGIARVLVGIVGDGLSNSVQQDQTRAERLLSEVLERDPNRSLAHAVLGVLRRIEGRLVEAQSEFEAAVALDGNDAWAVRQLGLTLSGLGQPEAAILYLEKAIRLSPREPTVGSVYASLGACHLFLGRTEEAIHLERKARSENPRIWWIRLALAGALGLNGEIDEARAEIAEALKLKPEVNSVAKWRAIGAKMGIGDPRFQALMEQTVYLGLRRAGFSDD